MPFEILHLALVLLRLFERGEGSEVAPFALVGTLLARVQTEFSGFELAYHAEHRCTVAAICRPGNLVYLL